MVMLVMSTYHPYSGDKPGGQSHRSGEVGGIPTLIARLCENPTEAVRMCCVEGGQDGMLPSVLFLTDKQKAVKDPQENELMIENQGQRASKQS